MKSYTDIKQSKKLAEILPPESADYNYSYQKRDVFTSYEIGLVPYNKVKNLVGKFIIDDIQPAWSLAALLNVIPDGTDIVKDKSDTENEKYMCTVGAKDDIISTFGNNPVDACVELILKLNELNML